MAKYFDSIIFGFLLVDGVLVMLFFVLARAKIVPGIFRIFAVMASIAWLTIFYGSFIEPNIIVVREEYVELRENAQTELRAVLLSDPHLGPYKREKFMERTVAKIMAQKPDIIFLNGDLVYQDISEIQYLEPLKKLQAPFGIFAVLGNHDYGEVAVSGKIVETSRRAIRIRQTLESFGIRMLINEVSQIAPGGHQIRLLGVDEMWTGNAGITAALENRTTATSEPTDPQTLNIPHILLTHNPDIIHDAQKLGIDLVLAGHTHGGQIRLPFFGPIPPIPDELGQKYDRGLFEFGKTQLFITSGIGEMGPRARLFTPPEIVLLKIMF